MEEEDFIFAFQMNGFSTKEKHVFTTDSAEDLGHQFFLSWGSLPP